MGILEHSTANRDDCLFNINKKANDYYLAHSNRLLDFSKPLQLYFGIEHFGYIRIYDDSKYFYFTNDTLLNQEYLFTLCTTSLFYQDLVKTQLDNGNEYVIVTWPNQPSTSAMDIYFNHHYWNGVTIANCNSKKSNYSEFWWLCGKNNQPNVRQFIIANLDLMFKFINCFNTSFAEVIDNSQNCLAKFLIPPNLDMPWQNALNSRNNQMQNFLENIYNNVMFLRPKKVDFTLTKSEFSCLELLAKGHTAKTAALTKGISYRTVEKHLENIKIKTGYSTKFDNIKLYNQIRKDVC